MSRIHSKVRFLSILFILLVLCIDRQKASAGINVWTGNGPEGGFVRNIVIDPLMPDTIYAGTGGGIYKSTDGGSSWALLKTSIGRKYSPFLVIDPRSPSTLYTQGGQRIYKSMDGGDSWRKAEGGIPQSEGIQSLAIDPISPGTLYAGTHSGIYKSTNGGLGWSSVNHGYTGSRVELLAIDPIEPDTVYALTSESEVFKTTNGGKRWTLIRIQRERTNIRGLAIDPDHRKPSISLQIKALRNL